MIKHSGPTPDDDMAPQIITDWKLHIGLQATWILCLSILPPGPWFTNAASDVVSGSGVAWHKECDSCSSPCPESVCAWGLLMHWLLPQSTPRETPDRFKWSLLEHSLIIPVACAVFLPHFLLPLNCINMLGMCSLWTASFFSDDLLRLSLLLEGVNACLLQLSSQHDLTVVKESPQSSPWLWMWSLLNQTERQFKV